MRTGLRSAVRSSRMAGAWPGRCRAFSTNGPVPNSDYRNDNIFLSGEHRWYTQSLFIFGNFNSNNVGEPGPYGSNPVGYFPGLDLISRSKNNTPT